MLNHNKFEEKKHTISIFNKIILKTKFHKREKYWKTFKICDLL